MKKIIRTLCVFLCAAMLMPMILSTVVSASSYKTGNYKGKFDYLITNKEVTITNINRSLEKLSIPSEIDGYPVTKIGARACDRADLRELSLPNTLISIGEGAFQYTDINNIDIPSSVKYIYDSAFFGFMNTPKSITLREGLEYIGDSAFQDLFWYVKSITIPSTVWYIGDMAFWDEHLNSVYFMPMSAIAQSTAFMQSTIIYGFDNSSVASDAVEYRWSYRSMGTFTGINRIGDSVYGYKNSKLVSGKKSFDGKLYYFDKSGKARKGFVKMKSGDIYYFSKKAKNLGQAVTGWVKKDGKKYYFQTSGEDKYKAAKGWMKIKGKRYYFNSDGTMATGKTTIKGKTYTFGKDGILKK